MHENNVKKLSKLILREYALMGTEVSSRLPLVVLMHQGKDFLQLIAEQIKKVRLKIAILLK